MLWYIRLNIYIWKTMFFSSVEMLRGLIQSKVYYKLFYFIWKEISYKPLKVAAAETSFPRVYIIGTTCSDEGFLFHVITGSHYLLYKFTVTQWFGATPYHVAALFETSILKDVRTLYPVSQ